MAQSGRWEFVTYLCCLPHDIAYAYGEPGNAAERALVDNDFYVALRKKAGMGRIMAAAFYWAVRIGGREWRGKSYSWAFATRGKQ